MSQKQQKLSRFQKERNKIRFAQIKLAVMMKMQAEGVPIPDDEALDNIIALEMAEQERIAQEEINKSRMQILKDKE